MTAKETSASIEAWADEAFGPVSDLDALVLRAGLELKELREAIASAEPSAAIMSEAADVAILLHRVAALSGGELSGAVDAKMAINRIREWTPAGDGTGKHRNEE